MTLTIDRLDALATAQGVPKFYVGTKAYNLLFGAVRSPPSLLFDDTFFCLTNVGGVVTLFQWPGTTQHGTYGNLVVPLGFHKGLWTVGLHKKSYPCLVQARALTVQREPDLRLDTGYFGVQCHHAGHKSTLVGGWSKGCQVAQYVKDHEKLMWLVGQQGSPVVSYWLMSEETYAGV